MKKWITLALIALLPLAQAASADEGIFGEPLCFRGISAVFEFDGTVLPNGNFLLFGSTMSGNGLFGPQSAKETGFALCADAAGDVIWSYTCDEAESNYVLGAVPKGDGGAWLLYREYIEGKGLTHRLIDAQPDGAHVVHELGKDVTGMYPAGDGGMFVDATTWDNLPDGLLWSPQLSRLDADGNELWTRAFEAYPYHGMFSHFTPHGDGYRAIGVEESQGPIRRAFIAEFDAHGNLLDVYKTDGDTRTYFSDIAWLPDGGLVAAGYEMIGSEMQGRMWRFGADGSIVFKKEYYPSAQQTNFFAVASVGDAVFAINGFDNLRTFCVDRIEPDGSISVSYPYTGNLYPAGEFEFVRILEKDGRLYIALCAAEAKAQGAESLYIIPLDL